MFVADPMKLRCPAFPQFTLYELAVELFDSGLREYQVWEHIFWMHGTSGSTLTPILALLAAAKKASGHQEKDGES